jgi:hypothetical protein
MLITNNVFIRDCSFLDVNNSKLHTNHDFPSAIVTWISTGAHLKHVKFMATQITIAIQITVEENLC